MSFAGGEGRGREEGSPVSVFGDTDREDPGVQRGLLPSGVAVTGACGPPPMSPLGSDVLGLSRRVSRVRVRRGRDPLRAGTPRHLAFYL